METYAKQSKSSARTLSARAGHGQPDMATILQAYRNRTAQLAALTDDDEQALQGKFTTQLQEDDDEALQGKFVAQLQSDDEEKPLQGKFLTQLQSAEEEEPLQQKAENRTGLPDRLKNGVENLSGYSLDAVKVHYNSPKPAQLQALAYTQGTDIHVGPGQERYLGHEAWHVVQQMQGRVQPTTQLQGVAVNDNEGLEREADVMGKRAFQAETFPPGGKISQFLGMKGGNIIQREAGVVVSINMNGPKKGLGLNGIVNYIQQIGNNANNNSDPHILTKVCQNDGVLEGVVKACNKGSCRGVSEDGANIYAETYIFDQVKNVYGVKGAPLPANFLKINNRPSKVHSEVHHFDNNNAVKNVWANQPNCFFCSGFLEASGIGHQDMRTKNVFPDAWTMAGGAWQIVRDNTHYDIKIKRTAGAPGHYKKV